MLLQNVSAVPVYSCFDRSCSTNEAYAIMPTDDDSLPLLDLGSQSFSKKEKETASKPPSTNNAFRNCRVCFCRTTFAKTAV